MSNKEKKISFNEKLEIFEIKMDSDHVAARNGLIWQLTALDRFRLEKEIEKVLVNKCKDIKDSKRIVNLKIYYDNC